MERDKEMTPNNCGTSRVIANLLLCGCAIAFVLVVAVVLLLVVSVVVGAVW